MSGRDEGEGLLGPIKMLLSKASLVPAPKPPPHRQGKPLESRNRHLKNKWIRVLKTDACLIVKTRLIKLKVFIYWGTRREATEILRQSPGGGVDVFSLCSANRILQMC